MRFFRSLARRWRAAPALPALAVLVLAVGTGAGTAVLGAAWAALLRPLPYPAAGQLVRVNSSFPRMQLAALGLSSQEAYELGQLTTAFSGSGFGYVSSVVVSAGDVSTQVPAANVTATALATLGARPIAGRLPTAQEDRPAAAPVAVISAGLWRRQLGGDARAIGQAILIDGRATRIVGVMPNAVDFAGTHVDLWLPLQYEHRPSDPAAQRQRANHIFTVIARMKPGITLEAARTDVTRAVSTWADVVGQPHSPSTDFHPLGVMPLADVVRGNVRPATLVLMGAVGLVLLIAGANASTLLLAQSEARRTEMAVRAALGATRASLWGLHAAETSVLTGLSAALALALAEALLRALASLAPADLAFRIGSLPPWQTVIITLSVAALTAAVCLLAPLSRLTLARIVPALAAEGRGGTASAERHRLRRVLVSVEIAVAVTLFAGAAVLVESFWRLTSVDPGFDADGVLSAQVYLPSARYTDRGHIDGAYAAIIERLRAEPGVAGVGLMSGLPPDRRPNNSSLQPDVAGLDLHTGVPPVQFLQFIDADALAVLGIPIVAGRGFTDGDRESTAPVALLNQKAAETFFKGADPVGRRIRGMGAGLPWLTVVGVVGNARQGGLAQDVGTEIFVPIGQSANLFGFVMTRDLNLVVRVAGRDPAAVAAPLRSAVANIEPLAAVSNVSVMRDVILDSVATPRFLTFVLSGFALVALLLCAAGVYGVVMHVVAHRTREIGVRRSLGAPAGAIVALIAKQIGSLLIAGSLAGLAGAVAGTRALQAFMFHTPAFSALRLALVVAVLAASAAVACVVPLLRALRVDPATALRSS
jgi:predicted permease